MTKEEQNFRRYTAYCSATATDLSALLADLRAKGIRFTQHRSGGVMHHVFGAFASLKFPRVDHYISYRL